MVDLPQHAAQVTALHEILEGKFHWLDLVQINLVTPYLLGYSCLLLLSYVVSINIAIKITLTVSVIAFIYLCIILRQELNGDERFDPIFLFGIFGCAWWWGFLTFILAAPIVVLFIILSHKYIKAPSRKSQFMLLAVGCILLLTHGLAFLFAICVGASLLVAQKRSAKLKISELQPYFILGVIGFIFWCSARIPIVFYHGQSIQFGTNVLLRPLFALNLISGGGEFQQWQAAVPIAIALSTLLYFGKIRKELEPSLPFLICLAAILVLPHYWMSTLVVYERFTLFLLPFAALCFRVRSDLYSRANLPFYCLIVAAITAAAIHAQQLIRFKADSEDFESIIAAADPSKRALSLVFEPSEPYIPAPVYIHYPVWYQVDKGGFVDFNFAFNFPTIVRFRADRVPPLSESHGQGRLDKNLGKEIANYDYVFVRGSSDDVFQLTRIASACAFELRAAKRLWWLLERKSCRNEFY